MTKQFLVLASAAVLSAADILGIAIAIKDGDTFSVRTSDQKFHTIRIAAIDAPELRQPHGEIAREALRARILDRTVLIKWTKRDRNQRIVGQVSIGLRDIGLELIREGSAWHATHYMREQSAKDRALYSEAEVDARRERKGLWKNRDAVPPWELRTMGRKNKKLPAVEKKR